MKIKKTKRSVVERILRSATKAIDVELIGSFPISISMRLQSIRAVALHKIAYNRKTTYAQIAILVLNKCWNEIDKEARKFQVRYGATGCFVKK